MTLLKFPHVTFNYYTKRMGRVYVVVLELFENGHKVYEQAAVAIRPCINKSVADNLATTLNHAAIEVGDHIGLHCESDAPRRAA